jgi:hypothetical protein
LKQNEREGGRLHKTLEELVKAKFRICLEYLKGARELRFRFQKQTRDKREEEDHKARTSKI